MDHCPTSRSPQVLGSRLAVVLGFDGAEVACLLACWIVLNAALAAPSLPVAIASQVIMGTVPRMCEVGGTGTWDVVRPHFENLAV